jgi:hypothetical protein
METTQPAEMFTLEGMAWAKKEADKAYAEAAALYDPESWDKQGKAYDDAMERHAEMVKLHADIVSAFLD